MAVLPNQTPFNTLGADSDDFGAADREQRSRSNLFNNAADEKPIDPIQVALKALQKNQRRQARLVTRKSERIAARMNAVEERMFNKFYERLAIRKAAAAKRVSDRFDDRIETLKTEAGVLLLDVQSAMTRGH